jgi:nucleoredoxin
MRRFFIVLFFFAVALNSAIGRVLPLTVKDVCLMLRSGFSSEAVQRELSVRHFAESFDAASEKALTDAGAAPALIDAIKNGSYASSAAGAESALAQRDAQAQKSALENERLRNLNTHYQAQRARDLAAPRPLEATSVVADLVKGDLVCWKNGSLARFDDEALGKKKLIALYFSAHWCAPCRKFTPQLIEFYNRVAPQHPEFEIVLVSADRSPFGMETYLRETQMPWPAVDFAKLPGKAALKKYSGADIPCLVVLDASGKVILDTYVDKKYIGPEKVLTDLDAIFAQPAGTAVTASR